MHRLAIVLVSLLLSASCGGGDDEPESGGGLALVEDAFVVDLEPVGDSRVSGTADFRAVEGETQVTFNLVGPAGTAVQATLPVHLHRGTCADLQRGVAYQLAPVGEGGSRTTLEPTLGELQTDAFAITVHAAGAAGEHVACGNLSEARAGTGEG
jgi:hypothetical protein